ncbi:MFS transporter, partial [Zwartia sp.]|uniref:MFS transporter n=1 Tax=Zwartia sp. TaxID=2978004 RepID=UPI0027217DE1
MQISNSQRRNTIAGAIGNALEFYDFIIYAYLAHYFAKHFFPADDPVTALIASYGGFAAGMLMRPIGGILIGSIGDRIGRKAALQFSVVIIAVPTVLIGLLPTYETIGILAPILLMLMRLVQGLSVGGEYSAAIVFLVERAPIKERGFAGSFSPMGAVFGLFLGAVVVLICTASLGEAVMNDWGWRLPFIASALLTLVGIFVRKSIVSDHIPKEQASKSPVLDAFKFYWRPMLAIGLANCVVGVVSFVGFMYSVPWVVKEAGVSSTLASGLNVLALALCCVMTIAGGMLGDRIGRVKTALIGASISLFFALPIFLLLKTGVLPLMLIGSLLLATGHGLFCGPFCACMASVVPAKV